MEPMYAVILSDNVEFALGQRRRKLDSITRLSDTECTVATSLTTKDDGAEEAAGVIFTVAPNQAVEVLTLEFLISGSAPPLGKISGVQVYYRKGADYDQAIGQSSEWQLLADTDAYITNELHRKAIIPTTDFQPVTLEPGGGHAFYAIFPAPAIKVKFVDRTSMGLVISKDDNIEVQTGVSMDNSKPFLEGYSNTANFHGAVHYQLPQQCVGSKITTDVILKFALNGEPSDVISEGLTSVVEDSVSKYMDKSTSLQHFKSYHELTIDHTKTGFEGRSDACPPEYETCSLFATTVTFSHASTLKPGDLQLGVLGGSEEIAKSVVQNSPADVVHASDSIIQLQFQLLLSGVSSGVKMNPVQRRYLEEITMDLLRGSAEQQICAANVIDEVSGGNGRRNLSPFFLRGMSQRQSGATVNTKILLQITAAGDPASIRHDVLDILGDSDSKYRDYLVAQQLRPGEINQQDYGAYFGGIEKIQVATKPSSFVVDPKVSSSVDLGSTPSGTTASGESFSVWTVVCFILIVMSVLNILYRVYKDCFQANDDGSLGDRSKGADFSRDTPPLEEDNDSEIDSVGIADLSDGDQESDSYSVSLRVPEAKMEKYNVEDFDSSDESDMDSSDESKASLSEDGSVLTEDSALVSQAPSVDILTPLAKKLGRGDEAVLAKSPENDEGGKDPSSGLCSDIEEESTSSEESTERDDDVDEGDEESVFDPSDEESSCEENSASSEESEIESEQTPSKMESFQRKKAQKLPFGSRQAAPSEDCEEDGESETMRSSDSAELLSTKKKKAEQKMVGARSNVSAKKMATSKKSPPKTQPPKKHPPKKHPAKKSLLSSQHSRGSVGPRNESGIKGRGVTRSTSSPEYHGPPRKRLPQKHLPGTSQHSRGSVGLVNVSGAKGRGVTRSKSLPEYNGPLRKCPPKKHLPMNSQHNRGSKLQSSSMHSLTKKLPPLEASRSNRALPENQSGMNGRRISLSKSMPMKLNTGSKGVIKTAKGDNSSNSAHKTAGPMEIKPIFRGKTPERGVRRVHSADQNYGKAGKIKFVPKRIPLKK